MWRMQYTPTLPTGEAGHKSRKIPPKEWTDIAPFIITSNHYGNSVRMYREVGAYCIRPLERPAKGV